MKTCDIKVKKNTQVTWKFYLSTMKIYVYFVTSVTVNSDSCEAVSMSEIIISFACCIHISLLFPTNCILLSKL